MNACHSRQRGPGWLAALAGMLLLLLFVSAFLSRCASMMTPTGGPRDSLPPVIVNMTPDNFSTNRPLVMPDSDLSFTGNFLNMLFKTTELQYKPNPVLERALEGMIEN